MKKRMKRLCSFMLSVCMLASLFTLNIQAAAEEVVDPFANSAFDNYITRDGHTLYDGDKPYKFVSFAQSSLHYQEDGGHFPANEYEMRDGLEAAKQMGAAALRVSCLWFRNVKGPDGTYVGGASENEDAHIEGPGVFNEAAFRAFDKLLQLCNEYGIRIIIPLIDGNNYEGSIANVAAYRGYGISDVWTNLQLIEDVKTIWTYVLNRTNYYTGVKYKDDPAILCWQIGNEMERYAVTDEWAKIISAHIKSIDQNHLVAAPQNRFWRGMLDDPNIDIVDGHMYGETPMEKFIVEDTKAVSGNKALMYTELGWRTGEKLGEFLETALSYPEFAGGCVWSLSMHNRDGGQYRHGTPAEVADKWVTYNYPGFDNYRVYQPMQEAYLFNKVRELAYGLKCETIPQLPAPKAPKMLPVTDVKDIRWRGSTGASGYDIERAESENGPWTLIGENIEDNVRVWKGAKLFSDQTAEEGKTYYYRVKAKNAYGESEWSNVRKSGDASLDAELQAEKDEYDAAKAVGQIKVEIPVVEGSLETQKPETIVKSNLPVDVRNQLYGAVVLKIDDSNAFTFNAVKKIDPDNENITAIIMNDRTLVPVRFIAEAFGCNVSYEEESQTVLISSGLNTVKLQIGSDQMLVGDITITIDQPAIEMEGRTFAPLRAVCENALGKTLLYKDDIIIAYDGKSITNTEDESFWNALKAGFEDPVDKNAIAEDMSDVEGNLLVNGGFESAYLYDGWTAGSPNVTITGEDSHSGVYSLKFVGNLSWKGLRQNFAVEKNTNYICSLYIKAPKGLQDKNGIALTYKFMNSSRGTPWLTRDRKAETYEDWVHIVFPVNSGSNSNIWFVWSLYSGTLYADDVVVVPADSELGKKYIQDYLTGEAIQGIVKDDERADLDAVIISADGTIDRPSNGVVAPGSSVSVTLGSIETVSEISSASTSTSSEDNARVVDDCSSFDKVYSYSKPNKMRVYTEDAHKFEGDDGRISRTANESAEVIYKLDGIKKFIARIGYHKELEENSIKFFVSSDGETWIEIEFSMDDVTVIGAWTTKDFSPKSEFPSGTNYFKIQFNEAANVWTQQLCNVKLY